MTTKLNMYQARSEMNQL